MDIQAASPGNTSPNPANQLSSPEFRDMVRAELSDILADFIATQEKRASHISLIERIVRVEEAQRSHEQLTKALLEQMNQRFEAVDKRFEEMNRRLDRFMFWSLGLTVTATFLIITVLR